MKRGGTAAHLRFEASGVPSIGKLVLGRQGLKLAETDPPPGIEVGTDEPLTLTGATPVTGSFCALGDHERVALIGRHGALACLAWPSFSLLHERRPPGLDALIPAVGRNAALVHADGGWRAVVLPSLGDIVHELGDGHASIRHDGQQMAVADDGVIKELSLPDGEILNEIVGPVDGLAYSADGHLLTAAGGEIGRPGCAVEHGSEIAALATASAAEVGASLHDDGHVSVWATEGCDLVGTFPSPIAASLMSLSPDGSKIVLSSGEGDQPRIAVLRASDGALIQWIEGARAAVAPSTGGYLITGDWGTAKIELSIAEDMT